MSRGKDRIVIRQQERQKISYWQRTLALSPIPALSLVLCAAAASGAEKNYTAALKTPSI